MNIVKFVRNLGKILRGGANPGEIFWGFALGFALGMIPGFNLLSLIILARLLFLNTNTVVAAIGILVGKILLVLLAPVTFYLGYAMIHNMGLAGLVTWCSETPVLAFLNLQNYCLMGGIPLIIILGTIGGFCMVKLMKALQAAIVAGNQKSGFVAKLANNGFVKFILKLVFGKQKVGMEEALEKKKTPLFNKGRVILAGSLIAIVVVFSIFFMDPVLKMGLTKGIEAVNGAEVDISSVSLSLAKGRLEIKGLQVTDPAVPENNSVQAESIVAQVSIKDLLRKRLVMDIVECEAMATDKKRESPGEVFVEPEETAESQPAPVPAFGGAGDVKKYYDQIKSFNEKLDKLKEYLNKRGEESVSSDPVVQKDFAKQQAQTQGYTNVTADDLLAKHPKWLLKIGKVSKVEIAPNFPTFTIEAKNLCNNPSLLPEGEKPELVAKPDKDALDQFLGKTPVGDIKKKSERLLDKLNPFKKK